MQFNRDASGTLHPLPKPSIDTGMGLERLAAVAQGVYSNYDSDLFTPLLAAIGKRAGTRVRNEQDSADRSMRVIADHLRAITFLMTDGILPSNEGRGYVLAPDPAPCGPPWALARDRRAVFARADRGGRAGQMGGAYPEVRSGRGHCGRGDERRGRAVYRDAGSGACRSSTT